LVGNQGNLSHGEEGASTAGNAERLQRIREVISTVERRGEFNELMKRGDFKGLLS